MVLNLLTKDIESNLSNPKVFTFKTNAQKFKINFSVKEKSSGNFPHVGISVREGIMVLYRKVDDSNDNTMNNTYKERTWYHVEGYTERFDTTVYMHHLIKPNEEYEVLIYGPILSKLETLEIEVPPNTNIQRIENNFTRNILVCGGLTSLGIGCTTPASPFSSILCRKFNAKIDNITYNNKNYLNQISTYFKGKKINKKYDLGILELDYTNQDDELTKKYLNEIIKNMSISCKHVICWICIPPYKGYKIENAKKIISELSENNIIFKDLSYIYDEEHVDICTYSGNFINDSGNYFIYKSFAEIIRGL